MPRKVEIDILALEAKRGSTHWLHPRERYSHRLAEIREKYYRRRRAEKYDPNQPRDELGRWTDAGGPSGAGSGRGQSAEGSVTSASALFDRNYDPKVRADDILDSVPGLREKVSEAEMKLKAAKGEGTKSR